MTIILRYNIIAKESHRITKYMNFFTRYKHVARGTAMVYYIRYTQDERTRRLVSRANKTTCYKEIVKNVTRRKIENTC